MTYLFFVEDYTKYNFSIAEIVELSEFAKTTPNNSPNSQNNEMCMTFDFDVRNPDILMNKAFELSGHPKLYATVGWGKEKDQKLPDYTNITVISENNNEHHVAGDEKGNIIFNPWKNGKIQTIINIYEVYIHGEW